MNGCLISRECSHGLIQYFPLIARVYARANVNKMLTEKKVRRHEGYFWVREKPTHRPVGTHNNGDFRNSASTPPLACAFAIILHTCKVVNEKSHVYFLSLRDGGVFNGCGMCYNLLARLVSIEPDGTGPNVGNKKGHLFVCNRSCRWQLASSPLLPYL